MSGRLSGIEVLIRVLSASIVKSACGARHEELHSQMLNINGLNCFVAAAEEVHFGRAAARLNMTQPTLSRHIEVLEWQLRVKLFERANRRVMLTMAGRIFLPEAKRILVQIENATNLARRTWQGEAGVLRLGYTATAAFVDLPLILTRAAAALPDVKILLKESISSVQLDALLADVLDVAILRPPIDRATFNVISLRKEIFVAALHSQDARAAKSRLTLRDFDKRPFIMYSADGASYSFRILTALFEKAEVSPNYVHSLDQNHAILSLVSAGMGAALVPDSLKILAFPNVIFKPVKIASSGSLELFMAWRPQNRNPALAPFLSLCRALFGAPSSK
jgi:DNA-binding transcriptional LysR family regulator